MTEPSKAALRKASEILGYAYPLHSDLTSISNLARHLDAESEAAREALAAVSEARLDRFTRRHILPESRPTVRDVLRGHLPACGEIVLTGMENALRDAGLLKETGDRLEIGPRGFRVYNMTTDADTGYYKRIKRKETDCD